MATPQQPKPSHINLTELKSQFLHKLGAPKTEKYFKYLEQFLSAKLPKSEFSKLAILTIGKENILLHNRLLSAVLKNALNGSGPKPKGNFVNESGSSDPLAKDANNSLINPTEKRVVETGLNGSGSDPVKIDNLNNKVLNRSGSDPKGKGIMGSYLDPIEIENLKKDVLNGSGFDPKPVNSGKTPSGHFGEALNSPPFKNVNNNSNNGKNAVSRKVVEEGEEVEQNREIMRAELQKGLKNNIDMLNQILGVNQKGNVSNNEVPAGSSNSAINDTKGTKLQNVQNDDDDEDVVITAVKFNVKPNNHNNNNNNNKNNKNNKNTNNNNNNNNNCNSNINIAGTGSRNGSDIKPIINIAGTGSRNGPDIKPIISVSQTGFNSINYVTNNGPLSMINESNSTLNTSYKPFDNGSSRAGRVNAFSNYSSSSRTGVQSSISQINAFRRAGLQGPIRTNYASIPGTGPQISNPLNRLSRRGFQSNYASNSGIGMQSSLNRIPNNYSSSSGTGTLNNVNLPSAGVQSGIPSNNASIFGDQTQLNPITDDLTRAVSQFCNLQKPITAPIGLPSYPPHKRPQSSLNTDSCFSTRALPDSNSLNNRLNKRLKDQGISINSEAAEVINRSLNDHLLNRVIRPAVELVKERNGNLNPNSNPNPNNYSGVEVIDLTGEGDEEEAGQSSGGSNRNPNLARKPNLLTITDAHMALQRQQNQIPNSESDFDIWFDNWFDSL